MRIIKRNIIINNNIKFRKNTAYEDIDFVRIAMFYCRKISFSDMVLYNYRDNENSITNQFTLNNQIHQKMAAIKFLIKKYIDFGAYNDYKDEFTYFIYKTYVIMVNYAITLEKDEVSLELFKELHDFFFDLVDYEYGDNKYIWEMSEEDRLAAEVNNLDYAQLFSIYS